MGTQRMGIPDISVRGGSDASALVEEDVLENAASHLPSTVGSQACKTGRKDLYSHHHEQIDGRSYEVHPKR